MENNQLAVIEESASLGTIRVASPEAVIERAKTIATSLAQIIEDKQLYNTIQGKKYVRVEGWTTLGAILGVLPREVGVKKLETGYEAKVELIRTTDGMIIGAASALCSRDERLWAGRDEHAVRSMAITRATSKAFRLAFSWIISLASYEATPAEEMPHENGGSTQADIAVPVVAPQAQAAAGKTVADVTRKVEGAISEKQASRFWAIAKKSGKTDEEISAYVHSVLKLEHLGDLHWKKYEAACKWAESNPKPVAPKVEEAPPWNDDYIPMDFPQ